MNKKIERALGQRSVDSPLPYLFKCLHQGLQICLRKKACSRGWLGTFKRLKISISLVNLKNQVKTAHQLKLNERVRSTFPRPSPFRRRFSWRNGVSVLGSWKSYLLKFWAVCCIKSFSILSILSGLFLCLVSLFLFCIFNLSRQICRSLFKTVFKGSLAGLQIYSRSRNVDPFKIVAIIGDKSVGKKMFISDLSV